MEIYLIIRKQNEEITHICNLSYTSHSRAEKECKGYNDMTVDGSKYEMRTVVITNEE